MNTSKRKKQIKDYINLGMRKLRNRKGYGVHSPFAFRIITEVIEEKLPFYAYQVMQRLYPANAPLKFKVAALLFRLANRFKARHIVEVGCDGGYTLLPLLMVDSRTQLYTLATSVQEAQTRQHLAWFRNELSRVTFIDSLQSETFLQALPSEGIDMIVVNQLPAQMSAPEFAQWVHLNLKPDGVLFVRGIQPGQPHETLWDQVCDNEEIQVTMDLYEYGLAIRRPHFFKQHYVISF